ncbi:hypothetical protein LSTR_LSTR003848 [Laodelphax striatellus]|uniref:Xaa-Pro dipeptidase n=1 Tax=Laodelphax striatellus TaxID=195883 RepID=A0A482XG05_LAOST|nr:hypothetical protein LSTR_LSTR003848 [Laodelphax striatellus]
MAGKQEGYFNWMFGVHEPDFYGALDVDSGKSILFIPRLPEEYTIFMGRIKSTDEFKKYYAVDEVYYVDEKILTFCSRYTYLFDFIIYLELVQKSIQFCFSRVLKTPLEIEVMRYVNKISSDAHKMVMQKLKPGMYEYQGEAIFLDYCYFVGGSRAEGYTCICASGVNGAILHYGHAGAPNDKKIESGELCLFDMGAKYAGYTADITVTFPISKKFTDDQKAVYNAVLNARNAVIAALKPGVSWVDMHRLSLEVILTDLKKYGVLVGDVDEMIQKGIGAILMPHGLGHFLGCDVHDVGGYLEGHPPRPSEPGFSRLRTARKMLAGMVVTVEPGCYFNDVILEKTLKDENLSKFFNKDVLNRMKTCGNVRIEDDVLITKDGCEVLTDVPRTVEEIEEYLAKDLKLDMHSLIKSSV